ncbi:MAG: hypothetical protein QW303_01400, partial [Nitrososphaerota archaeon]
KYLPDMDHKKIRFHLYNQLIQNLYKRVPIRLGDQILEDTVFVDMEDTSEPTTTSTSTTSTVVTSQTTSSQTTTQTGGSPTPTEPRHAVISTVPTIVDYITNVLSGKESLAKKRDFIDYYNRPSKVTIPQIKKVLDGYGIRYGKRTRKTKLLERLHVYIKNKLTETEQQPKKRNITQKRPVEKRTRSISSRRRKTPTNTRSLEEEEEEEEEELFRGVPQSEEVEIRGVDSDEARLKRLEAAEADKIVEDIDRRYPRRRERQRRLLRLRLDRLLRSGGYNSREINQALETDETPIEETRYNPPTRPEKARTGQTGQKKIKIDVEKTDMKTILKFLDRNPHKVGKVIDKLNRKKEIKRKGVETILTHLGMIDPSEKRKIQAIADTKKREIEEIHRRLIAIERWKKKM